MESIQKATNKASETGRQTADSVSQSARKMTDKAGQALAQSNDSAGQTAQQVGVRRLLYCGSAAGSNKSTQFDGRRLCIESMLILRLRQALYSFHGPITARILGMAEVLSCLGRLKLDSHIVSITVQYRRSRRYPKLEVL